MAERTTMNISITPELHRFIVTRVETGRYLSASEVVREALRLFEEQETVREMRLLKLKEEVQSGVEEIKRGEVTDGEEVFHKVRERISNHRKAK